MVQCLRYQTLDPKHPLRSSLGWTSKIGMTYNWGPYLNPLIMYDMQLHLRMDDKSSKISTVKKPVRLCMYIAARLKPAGGSYSFLLHRFRSLLTLPVSGSRRGLFSVAISQPAATTSIGYRFSINEPLPQTYTRSRLYQLKTYQPLKFKSIENPKYI